MILKCFSGCYSCSHYLVSVTEVPIGRNEGLESQELGAKRGHTYSNSILVLVIIIIIVTTIYY